ncbi:CAP domain-containing protein [Dietzia aurantiaca]|uniref:CAP domain-containing protein n=1 Tax=Dietzia aurantiaca TaxID=983873 RepID=A0ABV9PRN6_9ACTN
MNRIPSRLRRPFVAAAAAAVAIGLAGPPAASAQQFFVPGSSFGFTVGDQCTGFETDPTSAEYRSQLTDATNAARVANEREPIRVNDALSRVAAGWSGAQARENRMFHNPDVAAQIPPGWRSWSENVLQNYKCATPQQLVDQWMASPGHRANLLRADHTDMGAGVAVAENGKLYATQVFARY